MSSESSLFLILAPLGTVLSLALLFVLTAIWLKSTVRGFGLMALAEVSDLASRGITPFLGSFGLDYSITSALWVVGGILRLVGAYLIYRHYFNPTIAAEAESNNN
jgi:hypothetical protein